MRLKNFLYEKGRIYLPIKIRKMFTPELLLSKYGHDSFLYKYKTQDRRYFYCLTSEIEGSPSLDWFKYYEYYRKTGGKNLLLLATVEKISRIEIKHRNEIKYVKDGLNFLIVYSPCMHEEVKIFYEGLLNTRGAGSLEIEQPMFIKLDYAGKLTIPKTYRRCIHIDYLLKKDKYIEKKILMNKREFILEIWNISAWKKLCKQIKNFEDFSADFVFEKMKKEHEGMVYPW